MRRRGYDSDRRKDFDHWVLADSPSRRLWKVHGSFGTVIVTLGSPVPPVHARYEPWAPAFVVRRAFSVSDAKSCRLGWREFVAVMVRAMRRTLDYETRVRNATFDGNLIYLGVHGVHPTSPFGAALMDKHPHIREMVARG